MQDSCQPPQGMVETDKNRNLFKDAFKVYVGPGRPWSYDDFSAASGFEKRTVENWAYGAATPDQAKIFKCCQILGVEFLNRLLLPMGYTATAIDSIESVTYQELLQTLMSFANLYSEALLPNGGIDHRVVRRIHDSIPVLVNKLASFSAR
jgi:transcriptional regulator with XRE-family HTH domain